MCCDLYPVIAGLDPAIQSHGLGAKRPWMPGSRPGMTKEKHGGLL
jgi:hypothetical protein